jgi:hypothetical protein
MERSDEAMVSLAAGEQSFPSGGPAHATDSPRSLRSLRNDLRQLPGEPSTLGRDRSNGRAAFVEAQAERRADQSSVEAARLRGRRTPKAFRRAIRVPREIPSMRAADV